MKNVGYVGYNLRFPHRNVTTGQIHVAEQFAVIGDNFQFEIIAALMLENTVLFDQNIFNFRPAYRHGIRQSAAQGIAGKYQLKRHEAGIAPEPQVFSLQAKGMTVGGEAWNNILCRCGDTHQKLHGLKCSGGAESPQLVGGAVTTNELKIVGKGRSRGISGGAPGLKRQGIGYRYGNTVLKDLKVGQIVDHTFQSEPFAGTVFVGGIGFPNQCAETGQQGIDAQLGVFTTAVLVGCRVEIGCINVEAGFAGFGAGGQEEKTNSEEQKATKVPHLSTALTAI